ncbi:MAG TPA: nucleoside-diphosphate-sugar epimerase [Cytophagales bacterium]|jgi:nucleoside-diphosphate-sugar epimerase|nr:nucleoside-diphosphate-sugar epimerase [Cytophagales bacterium]
MKNVLITGISGFVGINLVRHFANVPDIVLKGYSRSKVEGVEYLPNFSAMALDETKIDTVIHLAGIAHDLSGQFTTEDYYRVNTEGTKALVEEVLKSNIEKFIYVSSIKAVCDTSSVPANESIQPHPSSDYGKSKLKAEEYILSKQWSSKSFYILRPGMMHGPGNKGNLNLLYQFVKTGMPFPLGAFHNQRSFLSIGNFCFVIEQLLSENKIESGIYHLADDGFLSTKELYQLIAHTLNKKPVVWNLPTSVIEWCAKLVGRRAMISKLTENMMISNQKITSAMAAPFPITMRDGLIQTIHSFDGK